MNLHDQAEAVVKAADELSQRCKAALDAIDAAGARRAEAHKRHVAAIDALYDMLDNFSKPKEVAKNDHPVGIAFIEDVGVREVKP